MSASYERLDFGPGWQTTNDHLVELVDLFPSDSLDWSPREDEWSARVIFAHVISARYHGPIPGPEDLAHLPSVFGNCANPNGIKGEMNRSWSMLARFLSDIDRLDAVYDDGSRPAETHLAAPAMMGSVERATAGYVIGYTDHPVRYTGHYIAYHRFAHDLHHRSTLIGYLSQLGVTLDDHRIRPL